MHDVYIASPIAVEPEFKEKVTTRIKQMQNNYWLPADAYFPADKSINLNGDPLAAVIRDTCLHFLNRASTVYAFHPERSSGVAFEVGYAESRGIPVYIFVFDDLVDWTRYSSMFRKPEVLKSSKFTNK